MTAQASWCSTNMRWIVMRMIVNLLRDTFCFERSSFGFEIIIDILFESWILVDNVTEQIFVLTQLNFQMFDVSEIDIILEPIDIHAPR